MITYQLPPDGSDDAPDANGQHTATVNVLHSAKRASVFYGCEQCRGCIESDRVAQNVAAHYEGWDGVDFTTRYYTATGTDQRFTSYSDAADAWRAQDYKWITESPEFAFTDDERWEITTDGESFMLRENLAHDDPDASEPYWDLVCSVFASMPEAMAYVDKRVRTTRYDSATRRMG